MFVTISKLFLIAIQIVLRILVWFIIWLNSYMTGLISHKFSRWMSKRVPNWISDEIVAFLSGIFLGLASIWLISWTNGVFVDWLMSGFVGFSASFIVFSIIGWMDALCQITENNFDNAV